MIQFEELLKELGKQLDLPLYLDKYQACSIQIPPLVLQMQPDRSQEFLFLFCKVIEIPPGKFRENVLREALKANVESEPCIATFGFLAATDHLILYQRYPFTILNGERMGSFLGSFFKLAKEWYKAIAAGQSAPAGRSSPPSSSPLFGIRP